MTQLVEFPYVRKGHRLETPYLRQKPLRQNRLRLELVVRDELARKIYADALRLGKRPEDVAVDGLRALMSMGSDA